MNTVRSIILISAAACLSACGSDSLSPNSPPVTASPAPSPSPNPTPSPTPSPTPTPTPSPSAVTEREVDPRNVAAGLVTGLSNHQIFTPGSNRRNRLFVMLPGTDAPPRVYRQIARTGAQEGFHAIGLAYPNDDAIATVCGNSSRPDCSGEVRNEILTGQDSSPLVSVNRVNSIIGRLTQLLPFLDRSFPGEGWGQYLVNGEPDWSRIVVAGHSQGAGLAGFLGKLFRLQRIGMFSGPNDPGPTTNQAALWTTRPNITPASDQFGFTHTADPLAPIGVATRNWQGIGLGAFGNQFSVDGRSPPFDGSRQLVTSAPPNPNPTGPTASPQHGAPAVDSVTPLAADGRPLFRPVWVHMLFAQ